MRKREVERGENERERERERGQLKEEKIRKRTVEIGKN